MTVQTEREYLVSKGLAKPSRGRFSKEAVAALADARKRGMKFAEVVAKKPAAETPAEPKEPKVKKPRPRDLPEVDPKAVRAWAAANGIKVGDRGRIDANIVVQYIDAAKVTGDAVEPPQANPGQDYRPAAERVRSADVWTAKDGDHKITKSFKDTCNGCGYSIGWCVEPDGPFTFGNDTVTRLKLTPGK